MFIASHHSLRILFLVKPFGVHRSPFTVHRSPFSVPRRRSAFGVRLTPSRAGQPQQSAYHGSPFTVWRTAFGDVFLKVEQTCALPRPATRTVNANCSSPV